MINIRQGVYETNSSSVHTLVMCTEDQYKQMEQGNILLDYHGNQYTIEEAVASIQEKMKKWPDCYTDNDHEFIKNIKDKSDYSVIKWLESTEEFYTLDSWLDNEYFETYHDEMTTPNGEKVIAFGYYGHD